MIYESEWDGFVAQSHSGIAEALHAAGVDCDIHARGLADGNDSAWDADYNRQPVSVAE
jgi:hypothetical protein